MIENREERWLSPRTVADRLDVNEVRVFRLLKAGALPSVKLGKSRRIPESALLKLMQDSGMQ
jgi:excisionase family DNA binding protein